MNKKYVIYNERVIMMTPVQLTRKGFQSLVDTLGYADAVSFIRQFDKRIGNYTEERHQWLDKLSLGDILANIQQRQENSQGF